MTSWFEEFNLWLYYSLAGAFYDVVIWCLGPIVDDSREYGIVRGYLAFATCRVCRACLVPDEADRG